MIERLLYNPDGTLNCRLRMIRTSRAKLLLILALGMASFQCLLAAAVPEPSPKISIKTTSNFFSPNKPEDPYTRQMIDFMRKNPSIEILKWGGINIPNGGKAPLMMAIAGKTAPDFGLSWFHIIRNEIKQQFLYPLNEWIGEDTNGNGMIDDSEAKWSGWKDIPPLWRKVATVKGKVYGIPLPVRTMVAILYRTDMVKAAGLDPNNLARQKSPHSHCRHRTGRCLKCTVGCCKRRNYCRNAETIVESRA